MAVIIFDLDDTVIDTAHRYRNKPGTNEIDLDYWFANSTPENIARDTLLPLAEVWRDYHAAGHIIVVCTARDFSPNPKVPCPDPGATYRKYLADNDLHYTALLHRSMVGPDHVSYADGALKTKLLNDWAQSQGYAGISAVGAIMFDDNPGVIAEMSRQRVICLDAISYNRNLRKGRGMPRWLLAA